MGLARLMAGWARSLQRRTAQRTRSQRSAAAFAGLERLEGRMLLSAAGGLDSLMPGARGPLDALDIQVDTRVIAVASPTTADSSSLPTGVGSVEVGDTFFVEVWVQDTLAGAGITGGQVDLNYNTAPVDATQIVNQDLDLAGFESGTINDGAGLVDDLGGGTLSGGLGLAPNDWVRLAYVEVDATAAGTATFSLTAGAARFALFGIGAVEFADVDLTDTAVVQVMMASDNQNNNQAGATDLGAVAPGQTLSRDDFTGADDLNDYFKFSLDAPARVDVSVTGLTGNANLRVLNMAGATVGSSLNPGTTSEVVSLDLEAGMHWVRVYSVGGSNADYSLAIERVDQGGDSVAGQTPLPLDGGMAMALDFVGAADPNDYYRMSLTEDSDVTIDVTQLTGNANLRLLTTGGSTTLAGSFATGTSDEQVQVEGLNAGDYLIRVYSVGGANAHYKLTVTAAPAAQPDQGGDTAGAATALSLTGGMAMLTDLVDATDFNDFYRITLSETSDVTVDLTNLTGNANLRLLTAGGSTTLAGSFNTGAADEQAAVMGLAAGDYLVRVYSVGGATADYKLTVNAVAVAADQGGDTAGAATPLPLTGGMAMLEDFVGAADVNDFYRVTLTETADLTVDVTNLTGNANLRILTAGGTTTLALSLQGGTADEQAVATGLPAGDYLVRVYSVGGSDADYKLKVTAGGGPDQGGDTLGTATDLGFLAVQEVESISDFVGAADVNDYYAFSLGSAAGVKVDLTGLSANANLRLLRSDGTTVVGSFSGGSSDESLTANLQPGNYAVRVYPVGSANTSYDLTIERHDQGGNAFGAATPITLGPGTTTIHDFVGGVDPQDFFAFNLASAATLTINLTNLTDNVNIRLLDAGGSTITGSFNGGTADEQIIRALSPGTYAIRVYRVGFGDSTYSLSLST